MLETLSRQADLMSPLIIRLRSTRSDLRRLLENFGRAMSIEPLSAITVHTRDANNDTPLHYAAQCGDVRAIEMLRAAGAELDAHGALDATPLLCAVVNGHYAAARRLLELGASPREPSGLGCAAEAAAQSHDARIRALFKTSNA